MRRIREVLRLRAELGPNLSAIGRREAGALDGAGVSGSSGRVDGATADGVPETALEAALYPLPPWLEWASSMMIAKRRSRCNAPMSSRMNGNFWTVVMMIFLPS